MNISMSNYKNTKEFTYLQMLLLQSIIQILVFKPIGLSKH